MALLPFAFNQILLFYIRWMLQMRIDTIIKFVRCQTMDVPRYWYTNAKPIKFCISKCQHSSPLIKWVNSTKRKNEDIVRIEKWPNYLWLSLLRQPIPSFLCMHSVRGPLCRCTSLSYEINALLTKFSTPSPMNFRQLHSIRNNLPVMCTRWTTLICHACGWGPFTEFMGFAF